LSSEVIGGLGFLALFILMTIGVPIGVSMGVIGFVGMAMILPFQAAVAKMAITPYDLISSYTFATIPLFTLMGTVIFCTGQGASLFAIARKWFGRTPGGLAMATIAACAMFGAVCASAIATAVTMALVALPALKEYKYDTALANGALAAGGPIGSLMPPSSILIIYGIITENSIVQLFVGGIVPGILVALSYIVMIGIRCWIKPELGPPGPAVSIMEKIKSLKEVWELICLMILSIGGLVVGIFTATEAGAVGAAGAFLSALVRGKLTWKNTREAFLQAMGSSGMIFGVIVGAMIFNYFCAASNLPEHLTNWVAGFNLPPMGIMIVIVIIYIILGALMDESSIQLLTLPIFYPLVMELGFDPIWFGVVQCKLLNIGMIAPPVGITVFVIAGLDKTVPMSTVYRGVMWFILCDVFVMAALLIWPGIITWLPSMMR
jgi:tripartite ATP-independent transporter DctM subunit